jgi:hypothetical protein
MPMVEARRQKRMPPGFQHAPEIFEHGVEVGVVAAEVENGAADDEVEGCVGVGDGLYGFEA